MSFYATAMHQEEAQKLLEYRLSIGITALGGCFSNKELVKRAREQGFVLSVMTTFSLKCAWLSRLLQCFELSLAPKRVKVSRQGHQLLIPVMTSRRCLLWC